MKTPSSSTVGASSTAASSRSFSSMVPWRAGRREVCVRGSATAPTLLPAPPAIGFFTPGSAINFLQLALGPLHCFFRLRALYALGEHVDDHVLAVDLGGLGRGRSGVADDPRVVGGGLETLHRFVDGVPQRGALPLPGGADREALGDLEPAAVGAGAVQPLQEVLGQLHVLRVLHD